MAPQLVPEGRKPLGEQIATTGHFTFFYLVLYGGEEWLPGRYYTGHHADNPGSQAYEEDMFGQWFRREYGAEPTLDVLRLTGALAGNRAYEADSDAPAPNDPQFPNPEGWFTVVYADSADGVFDPNLPNPLRFTKHLNRVRDGVHSGRQAKEWVLRETDGRAWVGGVCSGNHCNADYGNAKAGDKIWCTIGGQPPQPPAAEPAPEHHGLLHRLRHHD